MIEKLKSNVKDFVLFIVLPIAFGLGYLWHLLNQLRELQTENSALKADKTTQALKTQEETAKNESANSIADYERLRNEYLAGQSNVPAGDSSSGQGDSGPKEGT